MLTCEQCGCLVDPDLVTTHEDWHKDLVTRTDLRNNSLANPNRTKVDKNGFAYQEC